ncbi:MAG: GDP-mannose 4,6-dehydratase [Candidatus Methanoperedens sp.]|nr:GDP-mannose 4,6-dehydratase [Candidatus Methanoperedens sp.]MCE8425734.1 GDP-mannose 4,6-dehydratase [Candidatus Methanoperedens sp.]
MWQNRNVLITGATGFVGSYLVKWLLGRKARIKIVTKDNLRNLKVLEDQIAVVHGNITDPGSLQDVMKDVDVVFHLAAISNVNYAIAHPRETFQTNATGTLNLLEEARKNGIDKFVYISSSHLYGVPQYLPIDEKHQINPREPYAASKAAAEMLVNTYALNYGLRSTTIRPFNMYGAGQSEEFIIPSIIKQAFEKEIIELGNLTPTRDLLYISDAIEGMLTIAEHGDGTYNLGSGSETSMKELVETIINIINPSKKYVSIESRRRSNTVDIPRMCADVSRLKKLGWSPSVGLKEGLMRTIGLVYQNNCA